MKKFFLSLIALFCTQLIYCTELDDVINRGIAVFIITPITYIFTLAVIYGIKLGFWNDYLSKIKLRPAMCEHYRMETLLSLIVVAVVLFAGLLDPIFQIGIDLAFITVVIGYFYYQIRHSTLCIVDIIANVIAILALLFYVYKLLMKL